jgi:predicted GNAT family acetyltransferase
MPDIKVSDNWDRARYEISLDGKLAGFVTYRRAGDTIVLVHTEIDDAFEGHGLGGELARGALDDIRARGQHVVAKCPFIAKYVREHPEYGDLVSTTAS